MRIVPPQVNHENTQMVIKCSKNGETEMCKHEIRRPECKNSSTGLYVTGRIRVAGC